MNPGESVASPKSIISAFGGIVDLAPTAIILLLPITISPGLVIWRPSNIRAALRTVTLSAACADRQRTRMESSRVTWFLSEPEELQGWSHVLPLHPRCTG